MASDYLQIIESSIPVEPPVGSVVLDKENRVFQSYVNGDGKTYWASIKTEESCNYRYGQKWGYLVIEGAPLKLLWRGENKDG